MYQLPTYDRPNRMVVTRAMMVEVRGYNPIFARPYNASVSDRNVVNEFLSACDDGYNVTGAGVAQVASRIITPSAIPTHQLHIDGGVGNSRFVFMIEVEVVQNFGSSPPKTVVISGYTDRTDISLSGHIAPDTRFYINSTATMVSSGNVTRVSEYTQVHTNGTYDSYVITDSGRYGEYSRFSAQPYSESELFTMRPVDVIASAGANTTSPDTKTINRVNVINGANTIKSRRTNNMPSQYLANIVGPVLSATTEDLPIISYYGDTRYNQARAQVKETSLSQTPVFATLKYIDSFSLGGYVTYADLCRELNNLDQVIYVNTLGDLRHSNYVLGRAATSNEWSGADNETLVATMVSQMMPAVMANALVTYLRCSFTNDTLNMETAFELVGDKVNPGIAAFGGFTDPRRQVQVIQNLVATEIMPVLSMSNTMLVSVSVEIDLMVDAFISVSIDGQPSVEYTMPLFCDSIASPVLSNNPNTMEDITSTVEGLITSSPAFARGLIY